MEDLFFHQEVEKRGVYKFRFVGLAIMRHKFLIGSFGTCPRVLCKNQNVVPIGMSEELSTSRVKVKILIKYEENC
jgi:hypothetical protein